VRSLKNQTGPPLEGTARLARLFGMEERLGYGSAL